MVLSSVLSPWASSGGQSITVIEPTAQPFPDAATTAAITRSRLAQNRPRYSSGVLTACGLDAQQKKGGRPTAIVCRRQKVMSSLANCAVFIVVKSPELTTYGSPV